MLSSPTFDEALNILRRHAREDGTGVAVALTLHAIVIALIVFFHMTVGNPQAPAAPPHIVPVDVFRLGEETLSPAAAQIAPMPMQKRAPAKKVEESNPAPPEGRSPTGTKPLPVDNLDARLRALSRLHQAETDPRVLNRSGEADVTAESNAANGDAAYAVRDFVRQQITRHWAFSVVTLGARNFTVAIHIVMTRDGRIEKAEITDRHRYQTDAAFRDIALSARNAALLSSPVPLPAGNYPAEMDMTLTFDPRDVLH